MNYNPFSLVNRTILITGASSGIGRATAIECSKNGANVIITGRNEQRLKETLNKLEGDGHGFFVADLTIENDINNLVENIPQIDGCSHNAGISTVMPINFIKPEMIQEVFNINTLTPVVLTQRLIKKKKIVNNSSIVFTASVAGYSKFVIGNSAYAISKAGLNAFVKCAANEFAPKKIRFNSVHPGMVETPLINREVYSNEQKKVSIDKYPLKRYGTPEEIAYANIFFLSDASSWITGSSLVIDGGLSIS